MKKLFLVLCMLVLALTACGNNDKPVDEYCWEQASDYTIVSENDDGSVIVSLMAPDYAQLIQTILTEDSDAEISVESLSDAIKDYPEAVKEYIISVNTTDEDAVKAVFTDQIAKELAITAISRAESKEEWGDGK